MGITGTLSPASLPPPLLRASPIDPILPELLPPEAELAKICGCQALDEVFLHTSSSGHQYIHHVVLHEVTNGLPDARTDEVGSIAQENGAACEWAAALSQVFVMIFICGQWLQLLLNLVIRAQESCTKTPNLS